AGLIELAYLLGKADLRQRVELVAFTLEEPPFFRTGDMGSARYAHGLKINGTAVEAMICLEMIGYFSDEPGSQDFPSILLQWFYPDCGNFIALIGLDEYRGLHRTVKGAMRGATDLPVHAMCASRGTPGIDFSDHHNFWNQGYPAVMVTDTAFLRNRRYHAAGDTADRLDYDRMAKVVAGVFEAVVHLANTQD
uniref:M28 family peptidase n=1 Tax=Pontiella sp. TaxID=2837462 RepID=UPI003567C6FA